MGFCTPFLVRTKIDFLMEGGSTRVVQYILMNPVTVTDLTAHISALFETDEDLRDIWVTAEVSSWKKAGSGHVYFSLKDSGAVIDAVMWRGSAFRHTWLPGTGDQVLAHGYVGVYPERGRYQFYVDELRPAGRGQLYARFEALKQKLAAEGVFDEERKRRIPAAPGLLGVVTSPGAAALQDVLRTLGQRWPLAEVILFPTQVQGADAPGQIAAALAAADRFPEAASQAIGLAPELADLPLLVEVERNGRAAVGNGRSPSGERLDLILLVRGGGSIEDLWAFNEEQVAYAIAGCETPVISGVGHETDFTIADFAADERAPTPTAAAVAATSDGQEILQDIRQIHQQLLRDGSACVAGERQAWDALRLRLQRNAPLRQIDLALQRLDDAELRLQRAAVQSLRRRRERLASGAARLEGLNPSNVLSRGYSIVQRADGSIVTAPEQANAGERLLVSAAGGRYAVRREQT